MIACENSGHRVSDDFAEVSKIVEAGITSKPTRDYELSRYACYLVVQNGDPRKEVIALGQTYFAIQTYRQEVADHFNELDEDNRRLEVFFMESQKRYTKKQRTLDIIERLKKEYPDTVCTLDTSHAWQLLVSVRLAAQCTDARVNVVVQDLFAKYPGVKNWLLPMSVTSRPL